MFRTCLYILLVEFNYQIRPYTPEHAGSRLISEAKLVMAQSVLWWGTTREYCVLYFTNSFLFYFNVIFELINTYTTLFDRIHAPTINWCMVIAVWRANAHQ